jgi:hypothetical protein
MGGGRGVGEGGPGLAAVASVVRDVGTDIDCVLLHTVGGEQLAHALVDFRES